MAGPTGPVPPALKSLAVFSDLAVNCTLKYVQLGVGLEGNEW